MAFNSVQHTFTCSEAPLHPSCNSRGDGLRISLAIACGGGEHGMKLSRDIALEELFYGEVT